MAKDRTTIGQLRDQIKIVDMTTDSFGVFSAENTYTVKYTRRARVRSMNLQDAKRGIGFSTTEYTHMVIIRNSSNTHIDNDNLVLWRGDYYKIIGKEGIARNVDDPKKRFIRLYIAYSHKADAFDNPAPES
jgi:hypothetical protein